MDTLANLKCVDDDAFEVQFEVVSNDKMIATNDDIRKTISKGIAEVDHELDACTVRLNELNREIDRLTNHADGIDYMVAVGSGVIAGVVDILFVGELSLDKANEWGYKKINKFVTNIAQRQGYQADDLYGATKFLEEKYPIAADKVTNDFGGGLQHHLRDFSHHPTPIGLIFSLLTQFTHKVYGTDVAGMFKIVELKNADLILVGKNFPEKIIFGVINWFFHMVSDMAGSSGSILNGKMGTGLPGPIGSLLKEISALPIFKNMNANGYKELSVWISKLFNGTLLGERDATGKIVKPLKFDLRTEIGIVHQLGKQAIPVIINECVVRGFYFIRRFYIELKKNKIQSIKDLSNINWNNTLPLKNRTIIRMLTISTGIMTAIDVADAAIEAAIKAKGVTNPAFAYNMIVKVNFVGVGRFAIAVGSDLSMGFRRGKAQNERSKVLSQIICLSNIKVYYKNAELLCEYSELYNREADMFNVEADMWTEVEKTKQSIDELYEQAKQVGKFYARTIDEMENSFDEIERLLPEVNKMNPGLVDEMLRRLER